MDNFLDLIHTADVVNTTNVIIAIEHATPIYKEFVEVARPSGSNFMESNGGPIPGKYIEVFTKLANSNGK